MQKRPKEISIIGKRFGRLLVVKKTSNYTGGQRLFECLCDCGKLKFPTSRNLRSGDTKSCGCYNADALRARATHNMSHSHEFKIWWAMKRRCCDSSADGYKNYGGRGIKVCFRWKNSFKNFIFDMGLRPSKSHSIDRKNNSGNYEPDNCYWATKSEQSNNTRRNVIVEFNEKKMTLIQFCRIHHIESKRKTVKRHHFERGIPLVQILDNFKNKIRVSHRVL